MRCFSRSELEHHVMREADPSGSPVSAHMEAHLKECDACRKELDRIRSEQRMFENAFYSDGPDEGFTAGVMAALEGAEIEYSGSAARHTTRRLKPIAQWRRAAVAACALVLLGGAGWYAALQSGMELLGKQEQQPSITAGVQKKIDTADRERIGKLLNDPNYEWSWTSRAALLDSFGLVFYPDISLHDDKSGYRFEVMGILADASQIVILTRTTDGNGQPVSRAFPYELPFVLTGPDGREGAVHARTDQSAVNGMEAYVYVMNQPLPDRIEFSGEIEGINRMDRELDREEIVETEPLVFDYSLDLQTAKKYAAFSAVDKTYKAPDGLNIEVNRLIRTPGTIRVDLHTIASGEIRDRSPGDLGSQIEFQFRIEDQDGRVVGRYGSTSNYFNAETVLTHYDKNTGEGEWTLVYPMAETNGLSGDGQQPYKFILESYQTALEGREEITFDPSDLKRNPVVLEDEGDRFELTGAEIDKRDGIPTVYLDYRSEYVNGRDGIWEAVDENGQFYYPDPTAGDEVRFEILYMEKLPEQLTLRRTMVPKIYNDVGWSVDLPANALSLPTESGE
ncbi:hypothetical protein [Saccharibacillus kuerlensis]|uniref:DUF4179 domain-containing protein n=1 Tax=Saccharibacillus kuerlensis TaxID=459527 RepID=A0ABQ2L6S1_9BACL|nr:hypothetical protein [Saccharibacillus kuerlensis]GGO05262.1 hypothetical protein GCM10010969_31450 [Saccharibacillus kuerlensis]